MSEAETESKSGPMVYIILLIAVILVALLAHDALAARAAKAAGEAPEFLFYLWLATLVTGLPRFVGLLANMVLPGLAFLVPAVAVVLAFKNRQGSLAIGGGVLVALVLASNATLYASLAARPNESALLSEDDAKAKFKAAKAAKAAEKKALEDKLKAEQEANAGQPGETPPDDSSKEPKTSSANGDPQTPEVAVAGTEPKAKGISKIAYSHKKDGKWELWAMNPDGSGKEKISKSDRMFMQPRFSRDGTRIAFTTVDNNKPHVGIFDWATGKDTLLGEGDQASFSGDGKKLVFRRSGQVFTRDLETKKEERITPGMWTRCAYPSAAPGDIRLAVATRLLAGYNIYVLPKGKGAPKLLIGGVGTCDPRWSPTGTQLSYQTETHIWTIDPDSKNNMQVTFGAGVQHYAGWGPKEENIVFCQGPGPKGPWQIYVTSLVDEDADPVKLTKDGSNMYPDWGTVTAK